MIDIKVNIYKLNQFISLNNKEQIQIIIPNKFLIIKDKRWI